MTVERFNGYKTLEELQEFAKGKEGHWFVSNYEVWATGKTYEETLEKNRGGVISPDVRLTNICFMEIPEESKYALDFYLPQPEDTTVHLIQIEIDYKQELTIQDTTVH